MKKLLITALLLLFLLHSPYCAKDCYQGCLCYRTYCTILCEVLEYANKGEVDAMYMLGALELSACMTPPGVPCNRRAAFEAIEDLAQHGYVPAQVLVASYYLYGDQLSAGQERGLSLRKDKVAAYFWLAIASSAGDGGASEKLCDLQAVMSAEDIKSAEDAVFLWPRSHYADKKK